MLLILWSSYAALLLRPAFPSVCDGPSAVLTDVQEAGGSAPLVQERAAVPSARVHSSFPGGFFPLFNIHLHNPSICLHGLNDSASGHLAPVKILRGQQKWPGLVYPGTRAGTPAALT